MRPRLLCPWRSSIIIQQIETECIGTFSALEIGFSLKVKGRRSQTDDSDLTGTGSDPRLHRKLVILVSKTPKPIRMCVVLLNNPPPFQSQRCSGFDVNESRCSLRSWTNSEAAAAAVDLRRLKRLRTVGFTGRRLGNSCTFQRSGRKKKNTSPRWWWFESGPTPTPPHGSTSNSRASGLNRRLERGRVHRQNRILEPESFRFQSLEVFINGTTPSDSARRRVAPPVDPIVHQRRSPIRRSASAPRRPPPGPGSSGTGPDP